MDTFPWNEQSSDSKISVRNLHPLASEPPIVRIAALIVSGAVENKASKILVQLKDEEILVHHQDEESEMSSLQSDGEASYCALEMEGKLWPSLLRVFTNLENYPAIATMSTEPSKFIYHADGGKRYELGICSGEDEIQISLRGLADALKEQKKWFPEIEP